MAKHYRIFTSKMGKPFEKDKFKFVAEFADRTAALDYCRYMRINNKCPKQDIIFTESSTENTDINYKILSVWTVIGEVLLDEEYHFNQ